MNYFIIFILILLLVLIIAGVVFLVYYFTRKKGCDPECGINEICEEGICKKKPGCNNNSECNEGLHCQDRKCTAKCNSSTDCLSNQICEGGVCVQKTECIVGADCLPGYRCEEGTCKNSCTSNEQCSGSQVCLNNVCTLRLCSDNYTCTENEACVEYNKNKYCIGNITCENKCPEGLSCANGICKQCSSNEECSTGLCSNGNCLNCVKELFPCPEGKICSRAGCFSNGEIIENLPDGARCRNGAECLSKKCAGFCYSGECGINANCPEGKYCDNGICSSSILGSYCLPNETTCLKEGYCNNHICTKEKAGYGSSCVAGFNACANGLSCKFNEELKVSYCEKG